MVDFNLNEKQPKGQQHSNLQSFYRIKRNGINNKQEHSIH